MNTAERPKLEAPGGVKKVLLHSCCAPCEGEVLETMLESGITPTVFFYNPNIHPKKEYELRKVEDKKFCEKLGLEHHDGDYDVRNWFERVKGMEWEPELVSDAQVALICVLNERPYLLRNMDFLYSQAALVFPAGKI